MFAPKLTVPAKQEHRPKDLLEPRHEKIKAWLDDLPLANPFDSLRLLGDLIEQWNRADLPFEKRFVAMELVLPLVEELTPAVRREYTDAQIPLTDRKKQRSQLMQKLWTEAAYGYKSVIMDMLLTTQAITNPHEILIPSVYRAIGILSDKLVEAYLTFAPPPPTTWLELNQLFQFASTHSIADTPILKANREHNKESTINQAYRQALLLHLSDPYHLLPGEAVKLFDELLAWTAWCELTSISNAPPPVGAQFVDTATDSGPVFATQERHKSIIANGLIVRTDKLYAAVKHKLDAQTDVKPGATKQTTFSERLQRERYLRLARAWSPRKERQTQRQAQKHQTLLASGMNACYFHASNGRAFQPEQDETRIEEAARQQTAVDDLEVMFDADTPWLDESKMSDITAGVGPPRSAHFASHAPKGQSSDWNNPIYSGSESARLNDLEIAKSDKTNALCTTLDASDKGISLSYSLSPATMQARVGDLVTLRELGPGESTELTTWRIGATRWLRCNDDRDVELGIELLANDALPIGTRALEGVGRGTDYFRGLIIPRRHPRAGHTTILTLPAVYDVGTVLLLNTGDDLLKVRLLHLVESTSSFARYEFRLLEP